MLRDGLAQVAAPIVWMKRFTPDSSWRCYIVAFDGEGLRFGYLVGVSWGLS